MADPSSPSSRKPSPVSTSTPKETGEKPKTSPEAAQPRFRRSLFPLFREYLKRSKKPLLVGPWRGEVGFEVLYWIPFLQHLRRVAGIPDDRIIPITRGGMGELYRTPKYVELYAMRTAREMRVENRLQHTQTGMLKQMRRSDWDQRVIEDVAKTLGFSSYDVLDPAWMYQRLSPFWEGRQGLEWFRTQVDYSLLPQMPLPEGVTLPERFVCVKFYARPTFPANPMTANIARETIKTLANQTPVILLTSGLFTDDHLDYTFKEPNQNVFQLADIAPVTEENNLALQAQILSRSMGFVGTYGGVAQMALRMGKPSVSLYTEWGGTMWAHKHLSEVLGSVTGVPFQVFKVSDLPMYQTALPRFELQS